jgi:hydroxymethylglutaryl-CoA reductase (NADPH)
MPGVPAFILRRLYVKGSLQNTTNGWSFTLKNSLGSGYAHGLVPLRVDESEEIPMDQTRFKSDRTMIRFDQVNKENTFGLPMGRSIVITVIGEQLTKGSHRIDFACIVPGLGQIGFDFTDEVEGA